MLDGIVTGSDGSRFMVEVDGIEVACALRGRLKKEQLRVTSLVVIGDRVQLQPLPDGAAVIEGIAPRRSALSRPGFHGLEHVIAANVEQMVVVQAARQPAFKRRLTERFLIAAHRGGMAPLVVINKCELEHEATIRSWVDPLTAIGVPVLLTSALAAIGLAELRRALGGRISCFAGPSGTGKSSLVNALFPDLGLRTGAVAGKNSKGRHTTSGSRLYRLPEGGYLADTPGIRELGLFEPEEEVGAVFPEIAALAQRCKFRDCRHDHEPGCAVKAAVGAGEIDGDRYRHYLRLRKGD